MKNLLSIILAVITISACKPSHSSPPPSQPPVSDKPPIPSVVEPTPLKRTLDSMVDKTIYSIVHKGTTVVITFTDNTKIFFNAYKYPIKMNNYSSQYWAK